MSEKTEFARVVPAMIQDKSADWLLTKLDEQLGEFVECIMQGGDAERAMKGCLTTAEFRGRLIHKTFIAQYADTEITNDGINTAIVNSVTINSPEE